MTKPIIGILLDFDKRKTDTGGYSDYPWYALREHYSKAVAENGGTPLLIPYEKDCIDHYMKICSGFIFPGGDYDINPEFYGEEKTDLSVLSDDTRVNFESSLMKKVLDLDIPMLCICAGQQLLNILKGGNLYQDLSLKKGAKIHKHNRESHIDWHPIDVKKESKLYEIVGSESYMVNSHHHQAVNKIGDGLIVSAYADDGVVEAIEDPSKKFCVGVEWHPEYQHNKHDILLIKGFIKSCE